MAARKRMRRGVKKYYSSLDTAPRTEEILYEGKQQIYKRARDKLYENLVMVNMDVASLEEIRRYISLLEGSHFADFIAHLVDAIFVHAVMTVNRMWISTTPRRGFSPDLTLKHLHCFIVQNMKQKYRHQWAGRFDSLLQEEIHFEKHILPKLKAVRDKRLAHLDFEVNVAQAKKKTSGNQKLARQLDLARQALAKKELKLSELKEAANFLEGYFKKIDTSVTTITLPFSFMPLANPKSRSRSNHIINVLDALALETDLVWGYKYDRQNWDRRYEVGGLVSTDMERLINEIHARNSLDDEMV